ncbi:MAG: TIR domain-containing protein, partial [Blastocatellia bacterium]
MKDFFISYNKADRDMAVWIAQQLEEAGYDTVIQAEDMPPGSNFVREMDKGCKEAKQIILALSPDYLKSEYTQPEWHAFFSKDPTGDKRLLIPVRVRECKVEGLLKQIVYIDLVGKDGEAAKEALLVGVNRSRIQAHLPIPFPVDELVTRYCQRLAEKVSRVRIFGDEHSRELDQVFVELAINEEYERRPNQAEFLGLMDAELRRMRSVFGDADEYRDREGADDLAQRHIAKTKRTIKPDELLRRHTHAVVTGAPGCGKTTLLRYL